MRALCPASLHVLLVFLHAPDAGSTLHEHGMGIGLDADI